MRVRVRASLCKKKRRTKTMTATRRSEVFAVAAIALNLATFCFRPAAMKAHPSTSSILESTYTPTRQTM